MRMHLHRIYWTRRGRPLAHSLVEAATYAEARRKGRRQVELAGLREMNIERVERLREVPRERSQA